MLTAALLAFGLQADSLTRNLGTIRAEDGKVCTVFVLHNNAGEPADISDIRTACSCTVATCTKQTVEPGDTAHVTVSYNPNNRLGNIDEQIIVYCPEPLRLQLTGTVVTAEPFPHLTKSLGRSLRVARKSVTVSDLCDGQRRRESIPCGNLGSRPVTIKAAMLPPYITLENGFIPAGEERDLTFVIDGSAAPKGQTKVPVMLTGFDGKPSDSTITLTIVKK